MLDKKEKIPEFIEEKQENKQSAGRGLLKDLLDGSFLTRENFIRQIPYLLFLTFLAIMYIGNRYHAEKVLRQNLKLQNEIKELRAEKITTASELMYSSKQSEVLKMVKEKGLELEESFDPPKRIVIENKKKFIEEE